MGLIRNLAVEARSPPRGTSGERGGERGSQLKRPPLPGPLLLVGGEGEEVRIRIAQSQVLFKHSSQSKNDLESVPVPKSRRAFLTKPAPPTPGADDAFN